MRHINSESLAHLAPSSKRQYQAVIKAIQDGKAMSSNISEATGIPVSTLSRILTDLREVGVVSSTACTDRSPRIWAIADLSQASILE